MSPPARCRPRLGLEEGTQLPRRSSSYYYKNDALNDRWCRKSTSPPSAGRRRRRSTTSWRWPSGQRFLSGVFLGAGIRLIDFKMECGRLFEGEMMRIVVSRGRDFSRFMPPLGHQVERQARQGPFPSATGGLVEAYTEVARRLGISRRTRSPVRPARAWSSKAKRMSGGLARAAAGLLCGFLIGSCAPDSGCPRCRCTPIR